MDVCKRCKHRQECTMTRQGNLVDAFEEIRPLIHNRVVGAMEQLKEEVKRVGEIEHEFSVSWVFDYCERFEVRSESHLW